MSNESSSSKDRPSEPPFDALKEREETLKLLFRKGAQLTEELVKERDSARQRVADLEEENARLRAQVESDRAIRDFLVKIEQLEREKEAIIAHVREVEAQSTRIEATTSEIETELASLANLYVASFQLHSTLSPRGAMRHIKELLAQLVGAESFVIYLHDKEPSVLAPIASQGIFSDPLTALPITPGPITDAFSNRTVHIGNGDPRMGTLAAPSAVVPLTIDDRVVGVIVILRTLQQKTSFVPVDHELFKLLGAQAVSALVAARLFSDHNRELPPLSSFTDLGA